MLRDALYQLANLALAIVGLIAWGIFVLACISSAQ